MIAQSIRLTYDVHKYTATHSSHCILANIATCSNYSALSELVDLLRVAFVCPPLVLYVVFACQMSICLYVHNYSNNLRPTNCSAFLAIPKTKKGKINYSSAIEWWSWRLHRATALEQQARCKHSISAHFQHLTGLCVFPRVPWYTATRCKFFAATVPCSHSARSHRCWPIVTVARKFSFKVTLTLALYNNIFFLQTLLAVILTRSFVLVCRRWHFPLSSLIAVGSSAQLQR